MRSRTLISENLEGQDYPGLGRYVWRPGDDGLQWSPDLVRIYGRKAAPASEAEFMACLHPDDRLRVEGETAAFLTGEADSYSHGFRIIRPDGTVRYIVDRARMERDAKGRVTALHGVNIDVTDFPYLAQAASEDGAQPGAAPPHAFPDRDRLELGQRTSDLVMADIDYRSGTISLTAGAARLYGLGAEAMRVPRAALHATIHPDDRAAVDAQVAASLDPVTGGALEAEHRILHPDGSVHWLRVRKRIHFATVDGMRVPDRGILAAIDVTDLKRAEAELRESEERLSLAQEAAGIGVWDVALAEGGSFWTDELYDLLRIDRGTPPSPDLFFERVHPEDVDALRRAFETAIAERSSFDAEFRVMLPGGQVRLMVGQGRVTEEEAGRAARILGVNYDITDRKRVEIALRESEARLRMILDETVGMTGIIDTDGTLREANRVALETAGLSREEVVGKPLWETGWWTGLPEEIARLKTAIREAASGRTVRYDTRVRAANGSLRTIDFSVSPVRDETGAITLLVPSALDVTERKCAEMRLAERETQLALFVEHAPAAIAMFDRDFRYISHSARFLSDYGLPESRHLIGRRHYDVFPEIPEAWRKTHAEVMAGATLSAEADPFPRANGKTDFVRWTMAPWRTQEGAIGGAILFSEVITDEIEGRRALKQSEARYQALFESINAGFCVVEVDLGEGPEGQVDYRVVEANPAFYDRTDSSPAILGRWLREAAPAHEEHWFETYGAVARTGEAARFEERLEELDRWFDVYAFRIGEPEAQQVAILFHDISDRKRQEEHVDTLLKEVNHRAKNMLSLVNVIARQTALGGADGFIDRFTTRIVALATNQDILVRSEWKQIPLADLVRTQLAHFLDMLDDRITLAGPEVALRPEAAEKLGMALHELATNAAKYGALSGASGRVRVAWHIEGEASAQHLVMTWQEEGGPAVTPPSRSGFGSLISGRLLAFALDGAVDADFRADGLRWKLTCPLSGVTASGPAQPLSSEAAAGSAVLVVEDDVLLGMSIAETLADGALNVIGPARRVDEALALIASFRPAFAVLDVNLRGETSERVALELAALGIPFLCMSAYSPDQLPEVFRDAPFLQKPTDERVVLARIREHLDRRTAADGVPDGAR